MVTYDPRWPGSYDEEQQRLTPVLEPWLSRPIEHVGSTSVRGLVAKPIIDKAAWIRAVTDDALQERT
jgi:GrpB-like predicted nucleotidyltransferase (UPF0157 family)